MAVSKSAARMDYWREYFRTANADIFEIIEGAIMVAAADCPKEFRIRRDGIAQTLFSCKLIKCSGCDKQELALPVDDAQHDADADADGGGDEDDDDDKGVKYKSKLTYADGNCSKGSSKVINSSRNDDGDDEEENDDHHRQVELNESNHQVSNYSYRAAEALTDEMEQESQAFNEIMRIKEIIDNSPNESVSVLCDSLRKLQSMTISVDTLKATQIGKSVNALRKHASNDIRQFARLLIGMWKDIVDEWASATTKMHEFAASEATPESMNPSAVADEEQGLPSPPMDDLVFLNPHSMSLELSEKFFDGMDDNGNPRKSSGESDKNRGNGTPRVEKQNVTKWKQQKPLNGSPMAPKKDSASVQPTIVKPSKPPVANFSPGQQMKPNMDRKLRIPENPTLPKRSPVAPQQHKSRSSDEETVQDKLEATKRKLQESYQQAENAKRQRTIQVMELHDLPKQGKNQHMRPGNNHSRHWAHGRS